MCVEALLYEIRSHIYIYNSYTMGKSAFPDIYTHKPEGECIYVTQSDESGLIAYLKVSRNAGFKYF